MGIRPRIVLSRKSARTHDSHRRSMPSVLAVGSEPGELAGVSGCAPSVCAATPLSEWLLAANLLGAAGLLHEACVDGPGTVPRFGVLGVADQFS
jgi:hypothetical protein